MTFDHQKGQFGGRKGRFDDFWYFEVEIAVICDGILIVDFFLPHSQIVKTYIAYIVFLRARCSDFLSNQLEHIVFPY